MQREVVGRNGIQQHLASGGGGDIALDKLVLTHAVAFIISEDEELVFHDRPAKGYTKLVKG